MAFRSASYYQRAMFDLIQAEKRSDGYGSVISHLRCAKENCSKAIQQAEVSCLTVDLNVLREAIEESLKKLEKDNSTVYLEVSHFITTLFHVVHFPR